jgi:hypothetical protein
MPVVHADAKGLLVITGTVTVTPAIGYPVADTRTECGTASQHGPLSKSCQ